MNGNTIDGRCPAVASGDLWFNMDGRVSRGSPAVRRGDATVRGDGCLDERSAIVRSRNVYLKPTVAPGASDRRTFTQKEIDYVWERAATIPGLNPDTYRQDAYGNEIKRSDYGRRDSGKGWEVDHRKPLSEGGTYDLNNLQALHACENAAKGATWKYQPEERRGVFAAPLRRSEIDGRCKAMRTGEVLLTHGGDIDRRCRALASGALRLTADGGVDERYKIVCSGRLRFKPSARA